MGKKKTIQKILSGLSDQNFHFQELVLLLKSLDFVERIKGGHHLFSRTGIEEILNLQSRKDGSAKAYQVKQVRNIILNYKIGLEE